MLTTIKSFTRVSMKMTMIKLQTMIKDQCLLMKNQVVKAKKSSKDI